MTISPGTYLRLRREAAGKSIEEVALMTETTPAVSARRRAEWIAEVEADRVPISADIVIALHEVFAFDRRVLVQLIAIYAGATIDAPDVCLQCGCSWYDPCRDEFSHGCGWTGTDHSRCTACPDPAAADPAAIALPDRSGELPPAFALAANFRRTQAFVEGAH